MIHAVIGEMKAVICFFNPWLKIIIGFILAYLIIDASADKDILMVIIWWVSLLSLALFENYK